MEFSEVKVFFKSWCMYPSEEDCEEDQLNPGVIEMGINRKCYEKLIAEANDHQGANFAAFCSSQIDATDDSFYLSASTWKELEEAWYAYQDPNRYSTSS